jgi:hypothetical protein
MNNEHVNINFKDVDVYSMSFNDLYKFKNEIENMKNNKESYYKSQICYDKQLELINSLIELNNKNNTKSNDLLNNYIDKLNDDKIKLDLLKNHFYNNCKNIFNLRNSITDIIHKLNTFVSMIDELDGGQFDINDNIYESQFNISYFPSKDENITRYINPSQNVQPNDNFTFEHYQNINYNYSQSHRDNI